MATGATCEDYVSLLVSLFKRSPPEFLTNRWYSADIASWFYLLMWRFSISEHAVPPDAHLSWRPGSGNKNEDEDIADQEEIRKKKSAKTIEFARSTDCVQNLVTCCVASIPRWDYARSLESKAADGGRSFGVVKARNSICEMTKNIIYGNDPSLK